MSATNHTERHPTKLEMAHVLFMDIVGYSKLPMDHQQAVLQTLQEIVSATAEFLHAQASQEMIRLPTGDGMALVFFGDAEAAARCALEVSRALKSHSEILLRMGLHSGPVYRIADINANQNVAGGGINIAQRVMDCGDAGHILASQSVADVLGQLSSWKDYLHDLGDAEVKHGVRIHLYNLYTDQVGNAELPQKLHTAQKTAATVRSKTKRKKLALGVVAAGVIASLATVGFFYQRRGHALTDKDTIALVDFTNTTGDSVFDGALRQGLAVQLEQSPFLSLVSDDRIQQTLRLMGQPADAKLTPGMARDLCQRAGSKAYVSGSIANLGSQYIMDIRAVNCRTGDTLVEEQVQAGRKEDVLKTLSVACAKLRAKLGESLSTIQKLDTPLEQATTPSLEALQAYSLGRRSMVEKGGYAAAVPFFQRATSLDSNFAMAYASLGTSYNNLGEYSQAAESARKAYGLRERVSERERLYIESHYYHYVTGDLEKARQAYEIWAQIYPRDDVPQNNLSFIYFVLGQYDRALEEARENVRLSPDGAGYALLATLYLNLDQLEEAEATTREAQTKSLDSPVLHFILYSLAFLRNNMSGMATQVAWSEGKPGVEDVLLVLEADSAGYSGRLAEARELSRRAVDSAMHAEEIETAGTYEAEAAVREALFGNASDAHGRAKAALGLSVGRDVQFGAALALALAGDAARAQALADDLGKRFPEDTFVQFNYLPTIHAQLALTHNESAKSPGGGASKAIEALQAAAPYELGQAGGGSLALAPVYVRGRAYLAEREGNEAAGEFQKILDHRGIVVNEAFGALAALGLARAYAMLGDTAHARAGYKDFLTLWKDADPNVPILKQAKAEYAKLR
jgi:class 3 adenylate cyclase/tetratricopeptide (TPR) repeat protein